MKKNYRYPGTFPFEEQDSHLFFGREQDIERLYTKIFVEKMTVLYGKSGLGKTSLLQAGILPKLHQESDYQAITIRFRAYQEGYFTEPIETLKEAIKLFGQGQASDLNSDAILNAEDSLWALFKKQGKKRFVLFFDQFEELFTYPDLSVRLFKSMFGELMNNSVPKKANKRLQEALEKGEISETEFQAWLEPLEMKVVFAIRSDRMSLLDRLTDKIPSMLRNLYELKALELEQAREALLTPAQLDQKTYHFDTQSFEYEADVVEKILNFLSKNNSQKIETFQLQIFCRWAEDFSDKNKKYKIETHHVGNPNLIFENYYETQIQNLPAAQQMTARELIEDDLIYEKEERRISLYEGIILDKIKDRNLLNLLVNTRLLRAEPVQDGFAYELSHDTLVAPILKAKKVRVAERLRLAEERQQAEELRITKEKAEKEKLEHQKERKRQRIILTIISVALVILLVSVISLGWAFLAQKEANEAKEKAFASEKKAIQAKKKIQNLFISFYESQIVELESRKSIMKSDQVGYRGKP